MKRLFCLLLLLPLLLTGCSGASEPVSEDFFAMDTLMRARIWGTRDDLTAAVQEVNRLDAALSVTGSGTLAALNQNGSAVCSDELIALLGRMSIIDLDHCMVFKDFHMTAIF